MTTPQDQSIPAGLCQCGCGRETPLMRDSDITMGYVKGQPHRYLQGHGRRAHVRPEQAQPFKIDDVYCRLIPLSRGMYAIVDEADYERLARFKWTARWSKAMQSFYAMRAGPYVDGKKTSVMMHREILGLTRKDGLEGDHIHSGHTWDNRRKNLRVSEENGNAQNRRRPRNNSSGFKGVTYVKERDRYRVSVVADKRRIFGGYFRTAEAAHQRYFEIAQQSHREFANKGLEIING